jgi:hypothetical protein
MIARLLFHLCMTIMGKHFVAVPELSEGTLL